MKYHIDNNKKNRVSLKGGFTIIEVIVACTIISITVFALMTSAQKGIELSNRALRQTQANTLLEEGAESVKIIRDNNWGDISNLSLETPYYLYFNTNSNMWSLNTSKITPNNSIPNYPVGSIFNRTITISAVKRDNNDDISQTGIVDSQTKKITVTVSWPTSSEIVSKDLVFYIANIFN